ncbi:hypothetical protein F7725_017912 [Dissostichus mawsoni]|uniref:Uncharacterized protein n=1 Tax=Dissostichus mawsoni TaxID=36200 RepID=A0A7J5XQ04_DISMA|nr:hypothetical protein F7725_017912 [Dissostichus mawsoni]
MCSGEVSSSSATMRPPPSSGSHPGLLLPQLSSGGTPFPQDLEPISIVGRECEFNRNLFQKGLPWLQE